MRNAAEAEIKKLYHYQPLNETWLRESLTNNHVHFSRPAHFNDPWDCSPLYEMDQIITPEGIEAWTSFFLAHARTSVEVALLRQPAEHRVGFLRDCLRNTTRHSREITNRMWRIYCLTPHPDSILMWAHYAASHTGVCLEFDASVPEIGRAREVQYSSQRPLIRWQTLTDHTRLTELILLVKAGVWEYEHEFRIVCRNGELDTAPVKYLCKTTGDYFELPEGALSRVIVGANGDYEQVKALVKECRPDVAVDRARVDSSGFRIMIPPP